MRRIVMTGLAAALAAGGMPAGEGGWMRRGIATIVTLALAITGRLFTSRAA